MKLNTFSSNGIPGHFFISLQYNIKLVIDPDRNFFNTNLSTDKRGYDKLLLIHGCDLL